MQDEVLVVLISSFGVFIIALASNLISFGNRFANALATAVILVLAWIACVLVIPGVNPGIPIIFVAGGVVFVTDLIGNLITFSNRFTNALATAIVFALLFASALYALTLAVGAGSFQLGG